MKTRSAEKPRGYNKGSVTGRVPEAAGGFRRLWVGGLPGSQSQN